MSTTGLSNLLLIDLETSGVSPLVHSPLAVGLLPLTEKVNPFLIYVRPPELNWTDHARLNFRRFGKDWEHQAVSPASACAAIEDYLGQVFAGERATLVGHNIAFDLGFMAKLAYLGGRERFPSISHRSLDTHTMLYLLYLRGLIPKAALTSDGAFQFFRIDIHPESRHTAVGDVLATRTLFLRILTLFLQDSSQLMSEDAELSSALRRYVGGFVNPSETQALSGRMPDSG